MMNGRRLISDPELDLDRLYKNVVTGPGFFEI